MPPKFAPQKHHRRSIRLRGYDYTQAGAYYVTIVTYQRQHFFGEVVDGEVRLNELGQIVRDEWLKTAALRPYVELYEDEFVVMPNHVHGIIRIEITDGRDTAAIGGARRVPLRIMPNNSEDPCLIQFPPSSAPINLQ